MLKKINNFIFNKKETNIYKTDNTNLFNERENKTNFKKIIINDDKILNSAFKTLESYSEDNNKLYLIKNAMFGKRYVFTNKDDIVSTPFMLLNIKCDIIDHKSKMENIKPSDFFDFINYEIGGNKINEVNDSNIDILIKIYDCKFTVENIESNQYTIKIELPFDQFVNDNVFVKNKASYNELRFGFQLQKNNKMDCINIDTLYFGFNKTHALIHKAILLNNSFIHEENIYKNAKLIKQKICDINKEMGKEITNWHRNDIVFKENEKFSCYQTFNSYQFHNDLIQSGHNKIKLNFCGIFEEFYIYFSFKNAKGDNQICDYEIIDDVCINCDNKTYFSHNNIKNNKLENENNETQGLLMTTMYGNPIHNEHLKNIYKVSFSNLEDKYIDCDEESIEMLSVDFYNLCHFDNIEINIIGIKKNIGIYYKNVFYNI